jgi:hypothetical protein
MFISDDGSSILEFLNRLINIKDKKSLHVSGNKKIK